MDYYKIGQKVRKYRKAQGLSQEQLAERIGISVTHMSHIETGNTKLSLPVLVDIAEALDVKTDDLLFEVQSARKASFQELTEVLERCTAQQVRIITEIVRATKIALDKHAESCDQKSAYRRFAVRALQFGLEIAEQIFHTFALGGFRRLRRIPHGDQTADDLALG